MNRIVGCIFLALAFFVKGNDVSTPEKEGDELEGNGNEPGVLEMPSGYICRAPNPNWCGALEKRWLMEKYAKTRDEYTKFVFGLFDSGSYDNRTRPGFSRGSPDHVRVRLYIESLGPASASEMTFFQDLYLTQIWTDSRLDGVKQLNMTPDVTIPMYPDIVHSLWTPDTYFRNGISTEIVQTHDNKIAMIVKISTSGQISVTKRLRVKANCPMHLQYFPFDRQLCALEIGSFSYDNEDIVFKWASQPLHFKESLILSEFDFLEHNLAVTQFQIPTMPNQQTVLVVQYLLHRQIGLYIGQIFLPSVLIVFVSWITFYINPGVVPARASVGITCVLTMMTLTTSCIGALPTNLMYTPVDIYLGACFMFVFGALIEFAVVNFSETNYKRRLEREEKLKQSKVSAIHASPFNNNATGLTGKDGEIAVGFVAKNGPVPNGEMAFVDCEGRGNTKQSCWLTMATDPMSIDYFSRFLYPISFFIFNLIYWGVTLALSSKFNEEIANNVSLSAIIE